MKCERLRRRCCCRLKRPAAEPQLVLNTPSVEDLEANRSDNEYFDCMSDTGESAPVPRPPLKAAADMLPKVSVPLYCQRRRRGGPTRGKRSSPANGGVQPLPLLEDGCEEGIVDFSVVQVSDTSTLISTEADDNSTLISTESGDTSLSDVSGISLQRLSSTCQDSSSQRLSSNSVLANGTWWLQRYESASSSANAAMGERTMQINLLATAIHNAYGPTLANLTPKVELPKNIKKMLRGLTLSEVNVEEDAVTLGDVRSDVSEGLQWAFYEFEFLTVCLAGILHELKSSCGITDEDCKEAMLKKVSKLPKSTVNTIAQDRFSKTLQLHQQRMLPAAAAGSLKLLITKGMFAKLRFTGVSSFLSKFDFTYAEEWRCFIAVSIKICSRLRADIDVLQGQEFSTIPDNESDRRRYEETYEELEKYFVGSDESSWWNV